MSIIDSSWDSSTKSSFKRETNWKYFSAMAPKYELCVGLNKGHKTTKITQKQYMGERKEKGIRQARKKNVSWSTRYHVLDGEIPIIDF